MDIFVQYLTKKYGQFFALRDISFSISSGFYAVVGPNGSGKSTLLSIMALVTPPTAGRISYNGVDPWREPQKVKRSIGYAPQEGGVYEKLTVRENLYLICELYGAPRGKARELEGAFGLPGGVLAGKLSGGLKRRLSVAMAMVHEPDVLLLDEPTAGLDPESRASLLRELTKFSRSGGTALVATHIFEDAEAADQVIVLVRGRVASMGPPGLLKSKYFGSNYVVEVVGEFPDFIKALEGFEILARRGNWALVAAGDVAKVIDAAKKAGIREAKWRRAGLEDVVLLLAGHEAS